VPARLDRCVSSSLSVPRAIEQIHIDTWGTDAALRRCSMHAMRATYEDRCDAAHNTAGAMPGPAGEPCKHYVPNDANPAQEQRPSKTCRAARTGRRSRQSRRTWSCCGARRTRPARPRLCRGACAGSQSRPRRALPRRAQRLHRRARRQRCCEGDPRKGTPAECAESCWARARNTRQTSRRLTRPSLQLRRSRMRAPALAPSHRHHRAKAVHRQQCHARRTG
jgi:hypothetical protein